MITFLNFLFDPVIVWAPQVFFPIALVYAIFLYATPSSSPLAWGRKISALRDRCARYFGYGRAAIAVIAFRIGYALLLSCGQYYVWSQTALGKTFLNSPLGERVPSGGFFGAWLHANPLGYFLFYSWGRFWLGEVVAILAAYIFYLFLVLLKKYRERFFEEGDTMLGFALALIVGWPVFVVFVPIIFVAVIFISLIRMLFFKQKYTTLGVPFLLAALACFIWGDALIELFHLGVLRV